ncbi:MAG: phosphotransferase [Candidatus Eremiobacterota bacterium]
MSYVAFAGRPGALERDRPGGRRGARRRLPGVGGSGSRVSHPARAFDRLREFEGLPSPEVTDALAWARENLPPDDLPALLHGDLLRQNVLVDPLEPKQPLGLIDWEEALVGDPAYDLAVVTRGVRRPFQEPGGFEKLLESYHAHGGRPIEARHVPFHELCLAAGWLRSALTDQNPAEPPREASARLARILGMAGGRPAMTSRWTKFTLCAMFTYA